jgi:hypothetical protein
MEYYGSKIKDLLGITISTKKTISYDDLRIIIINQKDKIFKHIITSPNLNRTIGNSYTFLLLNFIFHILKIKFGSYYYFLLCI